MEQYIYMYYIYIYIHGFVTPKQKVLEQLGIHMQKTKQNKTKYNKKMNLNSPYSLNIN